MTSITFITSAGGDKQPLNDSNDRRFFPVDLSESESRKCDNCGEFGECCQRPKEEQDGVVMWPCEIETADFEEGTITLKMQCSDYKVSAGQHWLSTTPTVAKQKQGEPVAHVRVVGGMLGPVRRGKGMAALPDGDYSVYTAQQLKPQFKEFIKWAGTQGYDCAQTCNSDTGEWIALNPMTADLWKAWQAAHGIKGVA